MGVAALPSTPRSGNPERPFGRRILPLGVPSGIGNRGSGDNNPKSILILLEILVKRKPREITRGFFALSAICKQLKSEVDVDNLFFIEGIVVQDMLFLCSTVIVNFKNRQSNQI